MELYERDKAAQWIISEMLATKEKPKTLVFTLVN